MLRWTTTITDDDDAPASQNTKQHNNGSLRITRDSHIIAAYCCRILYIDISIGNCK